MMDLLTAAQQALADLDEYKYAEARCLLRTAIAEMEKAEPVAWQLWKDGELYAVKYAKEDRGNRYSWVPLYTHPASHPAPAVPEGEK